MFSSIQECADVAPLTRLQLNKWNSTLIKIINCTCVYMQVHVWASLIGGAKNQAHKSAVHGVCVFIVATNYPVESLFDFKTSETRCMWADLVFQCFLQFSISGVMSTFKDFQLTSEEFKSLGDSSDIIGGDCGRFKYMEVPVFCVFTGKVVKKWSCIIRTHKHMHLYRYLCKALTLTSIHFSILS